MALIHTPQAEIGSLWHTFALPGTDDKIYTLDDVMGENGLLVAFICNHCPYVVGVLDRLPRTLQQVHELGIGVVAISANDAKAYPADSFDNMKLFARDNAFNFPYLYDETQQTAKEYGAVCTPDFFLYNADGTLQYRGRLDSAGKNPADANTVPELLQAAQLVAKTGHGPQKQVASMGCSIKWKETGL